MEQDKNSHGDGPQVSRARYKNSAMTFPRLGFGLMRLPEKEGKIDRKAAAAMVDRAMACGVNYFDTAYMYHDGNSEIFVGEALANRPREDFYVTSKMPIHDLTCEADNERIFTEQLRRTKLGYFDFYFMHWLNGPHWEIAKKCRTWEFMKRMQAEGKIRKLGFSFHGEPETLREIAEAHPWDMAQIQLNYLDWELCRADEQYDVLTELGIPIVVMEPLKGGALVRLNDASKEIFQKANSDAGFASWGLRYVASLPNVLIVLSGMSSQEQMEENLRTFTPLEPLSNDERSVVAEALDAYRRSGAIPCTGCRYCSPCPAGVNIPRNLALHNQVSVQGTTFFAGLVYHAMEEKSRAAACLACGMCATKCPQKIDIPAHMKMIAEEFK